MHTNKNELGKQSVCVGSISPLVVAELNCTCEEEHAETLVIGAHHIILPATLDRGEVIELVSVLQRWLREGKLFKE